jgi:hypothetical protein
MVDKWLTSDFTADLGQRNVLLTEDTVPESMHLNISSLKREKDKDRGRGRERETRKNSRR